MAEDALPYQEPGIVTILVLTSFLLILNLIGYALDKFIYCGLVGQIFVGMAWGMPGGHWLPIATQEVFAQLGYLGLILLVFEGGLFTDFKALKSNLFLSIFVAITGIGAPIGISVLLMCFADATPLQAFAAGAALCSTSLGTIFTVLKTSGLTQSRLGVVLTSAAMLDDVVGLVMVQIISNLGTVDSSSLVVTVVRPIGVSLGFALLVPLACWSSMKLLRGRFDSLDARWSLSVDAKSQLAFLMHTTILVVFVAASSYAGTSNLFAAYLAGASISWYDSKIANNAQGPSIPPPLAKGLRVPQEGPGEDAQCQIAERGPEVACENGNLEKIGPAEGSEPVMLPSAATSENSVIQHLNAERRTKPEAIDRPETNARKGLSAIAIVEEVFNIGKVGTGLSTWEKYYEAPVSTILKPLFFASVGFSIPISQMFTGSIVWRGLVYAILMALGKFLCGLWLVRFSANTTPDATRNDHARESKLPRPKSLYPASILGCAMVARGEIGFLISSLAESRGIFSNAGKEGSSELFLIVTWAIMICTIAGPIAVGLLTRRVRRLQGIERRSSEGGEDPLGIWGIM